MSIKKFDFHKKFEDREVERKKALDMVDPYDDDELEDDEDEDFEDSGDGLSAVMNAAATFADIHGIDEDEVDWLTNEGENIWADGTLSDEEYKDYDAVHAHVFDEFERRLESGEWSIDANGTVDPSGDTKAEDDLNIAQVVADTQPDHPAVAFSYEADDSDISLIAQIKPDAELDEDEDLNEVAMNMIQAWAQAIAEQVPALAESVEEEINSDWASGMNFYDGDTPGTYNHFMFSISADGFKDEEATSRVYVFRVSDFGAEYEGGEVGELMTVPNEDNNHTYELLRDATEQLSNIDSPAELLKEGTINNWFVTDRQIAEKIIQDMIDMDYDGEGNSESTLYVDEISIEDLFEELKSTKAEDAVEEGTLVVLFIYKDTLEVKFEETDETIGQVTTPEINVGVFEIIESPQDFVELDVKQVIAETEQYYTVEGMLYYLEPYTETKAEDTLEYQVGDIVEVNQYDQKLKAEIIRIAEPDEVNPGLNNPDAGRYYLVRFIGGDVEPYESIVWEGRLRPITKVAE